MNQSNVPSVCIESSFEWAPGVTVEWWYEVDDDPKRPVVGFSIHYDDDYVDVGNRCVLNVDSGELEKWPLTETDSHDELRGLLTREVSEAWGKR
jgi:hypothetical protein